MFRVTASDENVYETHDEAAAVCVAVQWVSRGVESAWVRFEDQPDEWWVVERDTKVDDADPFYPAIVHRRR